jgi:hypothetical protein
MVTASAQPPSLGLLEPPLFQTALSTVGSETASIQLRMGQGLPLAGQRALSSHCTAKQSEAREAEPAQDTKQSRPALSMGLSVYDFPSSFLPGVHILQEGRGLKSAVLPRQLVLVQRQGPGSLGSWQKSIPCPCGY